MMRTFENRVARLLFASVLAGALIASAAPFAFAAGEDDNPPGTSVTLPFSHVDTLDIEDDWSDYFSVWLDAGQTLRVAMRCTTAARFGIFIYDAVDAAPGAPIEAVAQSWEIAGDPTQQYVAHKATRAGTHWFRVTAYQTSEDGAYALHAAKSSIYAIGRPTVPSTIRAGKRFNILGTITPGYLFDQKVVTVYAQKRLNGRWSTDRRYNLSYRTASFGSDDVPTFMRSSRYGVSAQLSAGRWRTRASLYDPTMPKRVYTSWREFTVR